jgi:3-hydroxyacyl-CoA dehydrogenase/enoyl-CoA hydratase/3-hydroxybutyryl-CoA epimerase/3-hydroxyacyl-CoA dehydrogenase/enoyl-CoA hydratase/3-hydroxybutyryl-CoA epimerase/enoyl-CoA isomerase
MIEQFHELPPWDAPSEQAARSNAARLVHMALERRETLKLASPELRVRQVGICGAGVMGSGIATMCVRHQIPVHLYDIDPAAVQTAVQQLQSVGEPTRGASPSANEPPLIVACADQAQLAGCELLIESVIEDRELKSGILTQLAARIDGHPVLTTNTSTIPIAQLSAGLPDPERFCGLHFCNPVADRRLVEVIRGPATDAATIAQAVDLVVRIGKLPIVVQDCPGFVVNRLLLPYVNEALEMVCQGANVLAIDEVARNFGMALGPIQMLDMVGTDVAYRAGKMMWQAHPSRVSLTPILPALVKRKRLGQKTGRGFYRYDSPDDSGTFDDELDRILDPYLRNPREFSLQEMTSRLFLPMLIEAARVVEEQVVMDVRDVDVAVIHGLAFPESRGGLLYWADTIGISRILEWLKPLAALGERMQPPELLQSLAATKRGFYDLHA